MLLKLELLLTVLGCVCFTKAKPPNIFFLLVDDQGWNDLSYNLASDFRTPNIDKLANTGLKLTNYYTQHICSPTRSSLMTGKYPIHLGTQHGVIRPTSPYGLPLNEVIIPQELKRLNYSTFMIGKWHLGFYEWKYTPTYRYFDSHFGYLLGAEDYYYHNRSYNSDGVDCDGFDLRNNSDPIRKDGNYSTWLFGNVTKNIILNLAAKQKSNGINNVNPWFIYFPIQNIHGPRQAPQYLINQYNNTIPDNHYKRRILAGMVTALDDMLGELIQLLQNNNLWNDTLFIYSSDNGGPQQEFNNNWPLRGNKGTLWEGGVKVPGFVNGGYLNNNMRGLEYSGLMHVSDWLPTICSFVGITPTNNNSLDGYDQSLNLQNNQLESPRNEILHNIDPIDCVSNIDVCGAIRSGNYKLVIGTEVKGTSNTAAGWVPLNYTNQSDPTVNCNGAQPPFYPNNATCPWNGNGCLYDISKDPCEYYDVKELYPEIYNNLINRLIYYNNTQLIPLQILYPPDPNAANPDNFNGFWSPGWYPNNSNHNTNE